MQCKLVAGLMLVCHKQVSTLFSIVIILCTSSVAHNVAHNVIPKLGPAEFKIFSTIFLESPKSVEINITSLKVSTLIRTALAALSY